MEKSFIRNIIRKDDIARISVIGVEDVPGKAFEIFSVLSEQNICIDIILQTAGRDNKKDIIFTIEEVDAEKVLESLYELFREDYQIEYTRDVSKISIIGAGMINNPGVAASVFKTVEDLYIDIQMVSTSEMNISLIIDKNDALRVFSGLKDKFIL